jgi:hypothetical protein
MAKRPEDRYATMGELAAALSHYLRETSYPPHPRSLNGPTATPGTDSAGIQEDRQENPVELSHESVYIPAHGPEPDWPIEAIDPGAAAEPATLEVIWGQWTAIVELFALRRSRRHVDWQAYHVLHQGLIAACRTRATRAEGGKRAFYRHLEDLALPWLTPKTLAQVDQEILFSLLLCCRRAEQELGREPPDPQASDGRSLIATALVWGTSVFLGLTILAWLVSLTWTAA